MLLDSDNDGDKENEIKLEMKPENHKAYNVVNLGTVNHTLVRRANILRFYWRKQTKNKNV